MRVKLVFTAIFVLSVWGMFTSRYLINLHYSDRGHVRTLWERYPAARQFLKNPNDPYEWSGEPEKHACDVNDFLSCGCVDQSRYSEIRGVGVAVFGFAGYLVLAMLSFGGFVFGGGRLGIVQLLIFTGAVSGFAFTAWLNYLEFFVIGCLCPHCTVSAGIMAAIFILAAVAFGKASVRRLISPFVV